MIVSHSDLRHRAETTLKGNDLGGWTRPAPGLYPHQWLWDSCFVAIGLCHSQPERAAKELRSILRGQWQNGMLPHMIYSRKMPYRLEAFLWGTGALSPRRLKTSGITQPPLPAIAVERVVRALDDRASRAFATDMLPKLVRFHQWIYRERDPQETGLAAVIHSWESGMDDTPYWTEAMTELPKQPLRWRWLREFRFTKPEERATPTDLQHMLALAYTIKANHYDSAQVLEHSTVVLQDLVFNCVLAAANESLERLAEFAGEALPDDLHSRFAQTRRAIEQLWDQDAGQYFSRNYHSGELVRVPTVAAFMPLFAGTASPAHAEQLRQLLTDRNGGYHMQYGLPSVPETSRLFDPNRLWRGPVWVNMNWFVIIGLERYGFTQEAAELRQRTLDLVAESGFREYFNPYSGAGLGATNFSWSAALALDMLAHVPASRQLVYS